MKGIIFFFFFTFFVSSVCGYILKDYLVGVVDFNNIILKGPWDVNIGILVLVGVIMYFIAKKIYKGDNVCVLRMIYDTTIIFVMSFIYKFILGIDFSFNLFSCVFISYFTFFPALKMFKNICESIFSNVKYKNEQNLLLFILLVIFVLIIGDTTFFLLSKFA